MNKGFFPLKNVCLLILWASSSLFFFTSKVYAGGYEEAIHSPADASLPPGLTSEQKSAINRSQKQPVVNWSKWEPPYWLNDNVCRENTGNIICFNSQSVQHLDWKIPSK